MRCSPFVSPRPASGRHPAAAPGRVPLSTPLLTPPSTPPSSPRWVLFLAARLVPVLALLAALPLATGCASPLPPVQWVRLPAQIPDQTPDETRNQTPNQRPDVVAATAAAAPRPPDAPAWQLMVPVLLPGHLDRDTLLVPQGQAGLQPLGGARWAEPLRDAVPRLLRQDLAQLLGAPLWAAPLPPGVWPARQLRLEITALDVADGGRSVWLQARWSLAYTAAAPGGGRGAPVGAAQRDPAGAMPPTLGAASFNTAADGADADALAVAHRRALWQLARRIAATP